MSSAANDFFLLLENCKFITNKDDELYIITLRQNSQWRAVVIRISGRKREALLSASGSSLDDAFEQLHIMSAESTRNHVDMHSFEFAPDQRSRSLENLESYEDDCDNPDGHHDDNEAELTDSDASAIITISGYNGEDDQTQSVSLGLRVENRKHNPSRRGAKKSEIKVGDVTVHKRSRSRETNQESDSDSEDDWIAPTSRQPQNTALVPVHHPSSSKPPPTPLMFALTTREGPRSIIRAGPTAGRGRLPTRLPMPPPPPWWKGRRAQPQLGKLAPQPHVTSARPRTLTGPIFGQQPTLVCLAIDWVGHGQKKMIESCIPTQRAICDKALRHAREYHTTFNNVSPPESQPDSLKNLRAVIRAVQINNSRYEISSLAFDDLSKVFSGPTIPQFEIEVYPVASNPVTTT
jgi:hypothetical protein